MNKKRQVPPFPMVPFLLVISISFVFYSCKMNEAESESSGLLITDILSENCESRDGQDIDMIVLHHTGSSADVYRIASFFQNSSAEASAHYIIARDGTIIRSVKENMRAWHAGNSYFEGDDNINQRSIGIELCNPGDNNETFAPEQIESLILIMATVAEKYSIPGSRFVRHRDVAVPAGRKVDTADNLDVEAVYQSVLSYMNTGTLIMPHYNIDISARGMARQYVVQEGDTWEYISWLFYDSPGLHRSLKSANPASELVPGDVLHIPEDPFMH